MAAGLKPTFLEFMNIMQVKEDLSPYTYYLLERIYNLLEDVYSVSTVTEIQEAIDAIGTGAGTIFIAAGTYEIDTTIDIDGCGSYVIYGHGDNTILKADGNTTIFNITCCQSCIIKTLKLDLSEYTLLTTSAGVFVNETNDNVVALEDVTIDGGAVGSGYGVDLTSSNCVVEHCNITGMNYGILVDGDGVDESQNHVFSQNNITTCVRGIEVKDTTSKNCTISGNICSSCSYRGIGVASDYNTVSGNTCNSSEDGILVAGNYNTISGNSCSSNTQTGIEVTGDYNTISSNTCTGNDANDIFSSRGGIYITGSYNSITGNSSNNNNNVGIGTSYGIYIAGGNENVVAANNANGNDIDFWDIGTDTTITYYVQDSVELQDAIDSIGTKAGVIYIDTSFTVSTTIDIDGGGSYIIRGEGSNSTLTPDDNLTCINITDARSVLLENFKIDVTAWTVAGRDQEIIDITEAANNLVIIDNVEIDGNDFGWAIEPNSDYVQIKNCKITNVFYGLYLKGDNCLATENIITGTDSYGMHISGDYCMISHNIFTDCKQGIQTNASNYINIDSNTITATLIIAGIYLFDLTGANVSNNIITGGVQASGIFIDDSNYCTIIGNICDNNDDSSIGETGGIVIVGTSSYNNITDNTCTNSQNAGAEFGYGIAITVATCVENVVRSNSCSGNDITWKDVGTNSDFEYRCSSATEIQEAVDSIAAKAGTITINADTFAITTTIAVDGGGSYIIEGQGDNTILTPDVLTTVFRVSDAISCIIQNLKIDAQNLTGTTPAITIAEAADNKVIIDNVTIEGDADLAGYGIQIESANVTIQNCRTNSLANGIIPTDENCIITGNICNSNGSYGIFLNTSNYITVTSNICNLNQIGIYITGVSTGNIILGNTIKSNTADGIFSNSSHKNTFEGNIIDGNITTNVGTDHAGITLSHSDNNIIIGNTIINNQNGGAGEGYGVYIVNATSEENIVRSNNISGNDIAWKDVGVNSDIEYRCSSTTEIQDAIDSIAAKMGTIEMVSGNITISTTIDVDGGGAYIIKGQGKNTVLLPSTDEIQCFYVTNAKSALFQDFAIDTSNYTAVPPTGNNFGIWVNEAGVGNSPVIVERIYITGSDADVSFGVYFESNNCVVRNCIMDSLYNGIDITGDYCIAESNIISDCTQGAARGIIIYGNYSIVQGNIIDNIENGIMTSGATNNTISGNRISNANYGIWLVSNQNNATGNTLVSCLRGIVVSATSGANITGNSIFVFGDTTVAIGIYLNSASNVVIGANVIANASLASGSFYGIYLNASSYTSISGNVISNNTIADAANSYGVYLDNSDNNSIIGNGIYTQTNTGGGDAYGIGLTNTSNTNVIGGNSLNGNDIDLDDNGIGTVKLADDTVYGVGWNNDKGTATKNAIYDKIELVIAAGGAPNAFSIITGITNNVVADNNADTLTLAAVGGLTIVGTAATDTITFTNTITQYTDGLAVAAVEAAGLTMAANIAMGANDITLGAGQLVDGKDVSTLCTTAEAHAFVEANALTLTADVTFNAGQLFDTKDVSTLCTVAEAHAYIEANALTLEQNLSFAGAQTVDGVDISSIVAFKTITGITNDVVADILTDTLTLAAVGGLTIVGTAATDTITFTNTITQYVDADAVAAVLADDAYIKNDANDVMGGDLTVNNLITAGNVDGVDVSTLPALIAANCTVAEAHAYVEANALTLTADVTFNAGQLFDGKDVSTLCTTAEAHAFVEANALTLEQNLSFAGAQTVDGVDISSIVAFKTITGITNDVVADTLTDTLTLAAVGGLTIVGTAATDTITFTNTITQYTDVMVENIIIAELVNGQSIDNAIDALVHTRLHAMNSALDHSANTWNIFYSNAGGSVVELAVGAANTMLVGNGVGAAPSFQAQPVAGDFSHNSLANIDAGDINHLTDVQVAALHTRLHWMNSGSDHVGNPWNMYYTRADGDLIELALGADDTVLTSTGAAAIPAFEPFDAKAVAAVEAAGLVLAQSKTVSFDAEQNDTTYSGICIDIDTTGCNLFDLVYVDGVDSVAPADADAIATMPAIGIVVAAGKVLVLGVVCDDDLIKCTTGGAVVYASTTIREVQEAVPAGVGDVVQIVGVCVGDHKLFVMPSLDWVVRV